MVRATMLEQIEDRRRTVSSGLDKKTQSALGQFFTPQSIAELMADLLTHLDQPKLAVLDAGAGIGSLSASLLEQTLQKSVQKMHLDAFEIDKKLVSDLELTIGLFKKRYDQEEREFTSAVHQKDFVAEAMKAIVAGRDNCYDAAILNPPYKKIHSSSQHRKLLRKVGI